MSPLLDIFEGQFGQNLFKHQTHSSQYYTYHNWSYGKILFDQPGAWFAKTCFLYAYNHKSAEKKVILRFKDKKDAKC